LGIENATDIIIHTNFYDVSFILSIISAGVVLVLLWQVGVLRQQNTLAYNPLMSLRFYRNDRHEPFIMFENVGHGTALDIDLQIFDDETNALLVTYRAFAVKKDEWWRTPISFREHPIVRMSGTYRNVRHDLIIIRDQPFDFQFLDRDN